MITWQKKEYGFHFCFSSPITVDEANKWSTEVTHAVSQSRGDCFVFADLRNCGLIPSECKHIIENVQTFFCKNGLKRSVVIVSDPMTTMQMKIVARETGIREWERYIDSSSNPDWEQMGIDWIVHSIDPDNKVERSKATSLEKVDSPSS